MALFSGHSVHTITQRTPHVVVRIRLFSYEILCFLGEIPTESSQFPTQASDINVREEKVSIISTNVLLCLRNHTRQGHSYYGMQRGIERVEAFADISRSALCCHSNEIRAQIANPPNVAQLEGSLYHAAKLHSGPCSSLGMRRRTDTHTDTHRQTRVTNIHFESSTTHS